MNPQEGIPLLKEEGRLRRQENAAKPPLRAQTGWSVPTRFPECLLRNSANLTTPSAPSAVAAQHFIDGASTPPFQGGESVARIPQYRFHCYSPLDRVRAEV